MLGIENFLFFEDVLGWFFIASDSLITIEIIFYDGRHWKGLFTNKGNQLQEEE